MQKISVKPRRIAKRVPPDDSRLAFDDHRRLRNALLALAELDPGWMWWVERNIPKWESLTWKRRMVERQARALSVKRYSFLGQGWKLDVIFSDYYFTDDGALKLYL
jgi:hypothetical protein